jgi:hypothetical protein
MRLTLSLATDGGGGSGAPAGACLWRGDDVHGVAVITRGSAVFRASERDGSVTKQQGGLVLSIT